VQFEHLPVERSQNGEPGVLQFGEHETLVFFVGFRVRPATGLPVGFLVGFWVRTVTGLPVGFLVGFWVRTVTGLPVGLNVGF